MLKSTNNRAGFTLVELMIVVVIVGILASLAIPAFQKVRANTQDKAVYNNLRQLAAAADQYFLEFGVGFVNRGNLVGPDKWLKTFSRVAGETYTGVVTQGDAVTAAGIAGSRTITYKL